MDEGASACGWDISRMSQGSANALHGEESLRGLLLGAIEGGLGEGHDCGGPAQLATHSTFTPGHWLGG